MTLQQLQADIMVVNNLLSAISSLFPNPTENTVISFLQQVDTNPILQDIILLVVNQATTTLKPNEVK